MTKEQAIGILALARKMYTASTDNQDIHCNRFPSWEELTHESRITWFEKAKEEYNAG
jgi:hypothetical protein